MRTLEQMKRDSDFGILEKGEVYYKLSYKVGMTEPVLDEVFFDTLVEAEKVVYFMLNNKAYRNNLWYLELDSIRIEETGRRFAYSYRYLHRSYKCWEDEEVRSDILEDMEAVISTGRPGVELTVQKLLYA